MLFSISFGGVEKTSTVSFQPLTRGLARVCSNLISGEPCNGPAAVSARAYSKLMRHRRNRLDRRQIVGSSIQVCPPGKNCGETWPFWACITSLKLSKLVNEAGGISPCFHPFINYVSISRPFSLYLPCRDPTPQFFGAGWRYQRFYGFITWYAWRVWKKTVQMLGKPLFDGEILPHTHSIYIYIFHAFFLHIYLHEWSIFIR